MVMRVQAAMKIKTTEQFPKQWVAIDDDTYDGPGSPIGQGPTEIAAIRDLLDVIEDLQDAPAPLDR